MWDWQSCDVYRSLLTAIRGCISELSLLNHTSTFRSTDPLSSTEDKIKNNRIYRRWWRDSLSLLKERPKLLMKGHHQGVSPHWVNAPHQELAPITEMSTSCFKKGKILFSSNPPGLHLRVLHFSSDVEEEVRGTSTLVNIARGTTDPGYCLFKLSYLSS